MLAADQRPVTPGNFAACAAAAFFVSKMCVICSMERSSIAVVFAGVANLTAATLMPPAGKVAAH